MEHISDSLNSVGDIDCFDDLPKLERDIAHFSISCDVPVDQIAYTLKCSPKKVRDTLNKPVVAQYIERTLNHRLFERLGAVEKLMQMKNNAIDKLATLAENGELPPKDLFKIIEIVGDRVPDSGLVKQTKQIHEMDKAGVRKEVLAQLKAESAQNIIEYKPKQVEVVSIAEEGNG